MTPPGDASSFSFGSDAVARAYDEVLVPFLFTPWAARLAEEHGPWDAHHVLDLATGTGIVAQHLAPHVGADGRLIGADVNPQMLARARMRCADSMPAVELLECSADSLQIADHAVDAVVCQQGFQFFPDRPAAAREIFRVLRPGGRAVVSTWLPVDRCEWFGAIAGTLDEMGEPEIAARMRLPFDHMPGAELEVSFTSAGFTEIALDVQTRDLEIPGGAPTAVLAAHATPIGPDLEAMSEERRAEFRAKLGRRLETLSDGGEVVGCMASHVLTARKPT